VILWGKAQAWLKAAWAWCRTHWQWLLPPAALLAWYLTRSKNITVASGAIVEHDLAVDAANKKASQESAEVRADEKAALEDIAKAQAKAVQELNVKLKEDADAALKDPEATNDFLKGVSAEMRK
jgi:hypothetical protein